LVKLIKIQALRILKGFSKRIIDGCLVLCRKNIFEDVCGDTCQSADMANIGDYSNRTVFTRRNDEVISLSVEIGEMKGFTNTLNTSA